MREKVHGMETLWSWPNDLALISGSHKGEGEEMILRITLICKSYTYSISLTNEIHRHTHTN